MKIDYTTRLCHSEELGLSCVCKCVHELSYERFSTEEIIKQIRHNKAGERSPLICGSLGYDEKQNIICELHPSVNNGIEKRSYWDGCISEFLCGTAREFDKLPHDKQNEFLETLRGLNLNPFEYANHMLHGGLMNKWFSGR